MVEGIIYCGVIEGCWSIYELTRAQQWTAAMTRWVAAQPELGNFTGECKVRRAELKQFNGSWPEALDELDAVGTADPDVWAVGRAAIVRGNLDRLLRQVRLGREAASRERRALGEDPQPGLALLRLARGSVQAAAAMVRRSLAETLQTGKRVQVLAAATEILLAIGRARSRPPRRPMSCGSWPAVNRSPVLVAVGQYAQASVDLARGVPAEALPAAPGGARHLGPDAGAVRGGADPRPGGRGMSGPGRPRVRRPRGGLGAGDLRAPRRAAGPGPAHR